MYIVRKEGSWEKGVNVTSEKEVVQGRKLKRELLRSKI